MVARHAMLTPKLSPLHVARRLVTMAARDPQLTVSLLILLLYGLAILGAGLLTSASPIAQDMVHRLRGPSLAHPFGTDQLGRDVFARVLYGGRASVPAALIVVLIGATVGTVIGAVAGYGGRLIDEVVMRITDMVLAFPVLVLAMAVAAALGASLAHGVIALIAVWWPSYVRVCRGIVMDLREKEYVVAARAAGRPSMAILFRVILAQRLAGAAGHGGGRHRPGHPQLLDPELPRPRLAPAPAGMGIHGVERCGSHGSVVGRHIPRARDPVSRIRLQSPRRLGTGRDGPVGRPSAIERGRLDLAGDRPPSRGGESSRLRP